MTDRFDDQIKAMELVTVAAKKAPTGTVECPACGDKIHYKWQGPRSMRAKCEGCALEFMS